MTITKKRKPKKVVEAPVQLLGNFTGTKKDQLHQNFDQWYACRRCTLGDDRHDAGSEDIVYGEGNQNAEVLIIGEAPGEEEEQTGVPFVGKSGHLLNQILAVTSINEEIK